jgi:hypothetical protein
MPETSTMHQNATLLLGIGAQRSGTTWLGEQIRDHPDVYMYPAKEMHFFGNVNSPNNTLLKFNQTKRQQKDDADNKMRAVLDDREAIENDGSAKSISTYIDFFERQWSGQKYYSEITPAYMALSVEEFQRIKDAFPRLKLFFIMRDPLARLWSALRFSFRDRSHKRLLTVAQTCLADERFKSRTDYQQTLENLDAVFDPDQVFIGFYEDMFTSDMMERFGRFLNIKVAPPQINKQINKAKPADLPDDLATYFVDGLMPQYDYIHARFGDAVPDSWLF